MGASLGDDAYSIPTLARLLHTLPHLNVTLHRVNSTFDPQSPVYLEVGEEQSPLLFVPASSNILLLVTPSLKEPRRIRDVDNYN